MPCMLQYRKYTWYQKPSNRKVLIIPNMGYTWLYFLKRKVVGANGIGLNTLAILESVFEASLDMELVAWCCCLP